MIYKLEDRVLFDAALPVDVEVASETTETTETPVVDEVCDDACAESFGSESAEVVEEVSDRLFELAEDVSDSTNELYVIDTAVADYQQIVDNLADGAQVVLLESGETLSDLTDAIGEYRDLDTIHILTHASDASIQIGTSELTNENLELYCADFSAWNSSLVEDGDILFYGCNVAGSAEGELLVETIGALTGAGIAASDDRTGVAGDWVMEYQTGVITSEAIEVSDYQYNLRTWLVDLGTDVDDGDFTEGNLTFREAVLNAKDGDTITFAKELKGQTITLTSGLEFVDSVIINGDTDSTVDSDGDGIADNDRDVTIAQSSGSIEVTLDSSDTVTFQNISLVGGGDETIYTNNGVMLVLDNVGLSNTTKEALVIDDTVGIIEISNSEIFSLASDAIKVTYGKDLDLKISNSSISSSGGNGIDIYSSSSASGGQVLIDSSTISNTANSAIYIRHTGAAVNVVVLNSTFAENGTASSGWKGAIEAHKNANANIAVIQSTIGLNTGTSSKYQGVRLLGGDGSGVQTLVYQNSVIAQNSSGPILKKSNVTAINLGNNRTSGGSTNVGLTTLGENGGTTQTIGLDPNKSGIIGAGAAQLKLFYNTTDGYYYESGGAYTKLGATTPFTPTDPNADRVSNGFDQRGVARSDGGVDRGAVEYEAVVPLLSSSTPADNRLSVAVDGNITLTFNEKISILDSSDITLKRASDDVVIAASVLLDSLSKTITINPDSDLAKGVEYYVSIDGSAIEDLAGIAFAGITDSTTLNFTTIAAPAPVDSGSDADTNSDDTIVHVEDTVPDQIVLTDQPLADGETIEVTLLNSLTGGSYDSMVEQYSGKSAEGTIVLNGDDHYAPFRVSSPELGSFEILDRAWNTNDVSTETSSLILSLDQEQSYSVRELQKRYEGVDIEQFDRNDDGIIDEEERKKLFELLEDSGDIDIPLTYQPKPVLESPLQVAAAFQSPLQRSLSLIL